MRTEQKQDFKEFLKIGFSKSRCVSSVTFEVTMCKSHDPSHDPANLFKFRSCLKSWTLKNYIMHKNPKMLTRCMHKCRCWNHIDRSVAPELELMLNSPAGTHHGESQCCRYEKKCSQMQMSTVQNITSRGNINIIKRTCVQNARVENYSCNMSYNTRQASLFSQSRSIMSRTLAGIGTPFAL